MKATTILFRIAALSFCGTLAQASTVITFDDLPDVTPVTNQYQAQNLLVFPPPGGALAQDFSQFFTPVSAPNVLTLYPIANTTCICTFEVDFAPAVGTWSSFGFYRIGASHIFHTGGFSMMAFDAAGNALGQASEGPATPGESDFSQVDDIPLANGPGLLDGSLRISSADIPITGISKVEVFIESDSAGVFSIDNVTFDNFSQTPEPAPWIALLPALAALVAMKRHR